MTREEAIKRLEVVRTNALIQKANGASEYWQEEIDGTIEAIDMAIEALSAEATKKKAELKDNGDWDCPDVSCDECDHHRSVSWCSLAIPNHEKIDDTYKMVNEAFFEGFHAAEKRYRFLIETVEELDKKSADAVAVVRKPIKGYEDYYEVDQFGRVFAKDRTIHVTDHDREYDKHLPSRQMKQSVHTKGYKTVPLTKDGVCTTKFVHRLVAEAFIPNPDDFPFVNHIDEDKTNNFVENLEWCTEQYNSTYGKAREKHAKALKGRRHTEEHKRKISDSLKRFYGERREA